jgi:hypothetical protein
MDAQQRAALIVHDATECPHDRAGRDCRPCARTLFHLEAHREAAQAAGRYAVDVLVRALRMSDRHVDALRYIVRTQARRLEELRTAVARRDGAIVDTQLVAGVWTPGPV